MPGNIQSAMNMCDQKSQRALSLSGLDVRPMDTGTEVLFWK